MASPWHGMNCRTQKWGNLGLLDLPLVTYRNRLGRIIWCLILTKDLTARNEEDKGVLEKKVKQKKENKEKDKHKMEKKKGIQKKGKKVKKK